MSRTAAQLAGAAPPFADPAVAAAFQAFPAQPRKRLLALRRLVFVTAAGNPQVGPIQEALRWGEPAYLTPASRSGSTLRLGWRPADPERCALFFHCRTNLVETFRTWFGDELEYEGNRAVLLPVAGTLPREAVAFCIRAALTYHQSRRGAAR
jgi:hypothetical protein